MPPKGSHTLEVRERTALGLLASSMFAEGQELPSDGDLARCLDGYVAQLLRPHPEPGRGEARTAYEIRSTTDAPVFRRLATTMDALSLGLGPWSGLGRALSSWAARINLAVAEAERRTVMLYGPSNDLLAMAAALRDDGHDEPIAERLAASHPRLVERRIVAEAPPAERDRLPHSGRVWSRSEDRHRGRRRR